MKGRMVVRRWARRGLDYLPQGRTLPDDVWRVRHRTLTWLLFLHLPAIVAFGVSQGVPLGHVLAETSVVALCAVVAASTSDWRRREFGAAAAAVGLVSCSAVLVHLAGGMIEMHFHFVVVLSAVALYQDWLPFLVAVGYVGVHHGIV
jgi:hypothetical protein